MDKQKRKNNVYMVNERSFEKLPDNCFCFLGYNGHLPNTYTENPLEIVVDRSVPMLQWPCLKTPIQLQTNKTIAISPYALCGSETAFQHSKNSPHVAIYSSSMLKLK